MKNIVFSLLAFALIGCGGGKNKTNIELLQDMFDQESLKAQDWDPKRKGEPAVLVPPENTIPRNHKVYKYKGDFEAAEKNLSNELASDFSPEVIDRGRELFVRNCAMCHGETGKGEGQIAQYMPLKPPVLVSEKVMNFKDGRIFHIITEGQGVMGSHASQIRSSKDRWAVVNYIRLLQKNAKNQ